MNKKTICKHKNLLTLEMTLFACLLDDILCDYFTVQTNGRTNQQKCVCVRVCI